MEKNPNIINDDVSDISKKFGAVASKLSNESQGELANNHFEDDTNKSERDKERFKYILRTRSLSTSNYTSTIHFLQ